MGVLIKFYLNINIYFGTILIVENGFGNPNLVKVKQSFFSLLLWTRSQVLKQILERKNIIDSLSITEMLYSW